MGRQGSTGSDRLTLSMEGISSRRDGDADPASASNTANRVGPDAKNELSAYRQAN